jgi:hypothetical protein
MLGKLRAAKVMEIRVLDIRLLPGNKVTRAFVDLEFEGITIRDFRVYQPNGNPSVRNPFNTYKDRTGKLSFREVISLPSKVQAEVNVLILSEFFRRLKETGNARGTD